MSRGWVAEAAAATAAEDAAAWAAKVWFLRRSPMEIVAVIFDLYIDEAEPMLGF